MAVFHNCKRAPHHEYKSLFRHSPAARRHYLRPTCLHALYRYYGDDITQDEVNAQVPQWQAGGILAVYLAIHALRRGYQTTILPYNLALFDPTWNNLDTARIREKLKAQLPHKQELPGFEEVSRAY
jgi:hypothetical protein